MKSISLQQRQNKSVLYACMNQLILARGCAIIGALCLVAGLANGQQRPPELEAVSWNLGANVEATGVNGVISKISGGTSTSSWNGGATSSKSILRDGAVVFSAASGSQLEVGLSLVSANDGYLEIDFGILLVTSNTAQVYQNGVAISGAGLLGSYNNNTVFSIRRTGTKIEYLKDGVVRYTSLITSAGKMIVDCSFRFYSTITSCQIATGDLDNDGMADNWEEDQLPPLHSWTDVANFLPGKDNDLDGVSNLTEFQTGTGAMDGLSRSVPVNWLTATTFQLNTTLTRNPGGIKKMTSGTSTAFDARAFASQMIVEDGQIMFMVKPGTLMTAGFNTSNVMPDATSVTTDLEWSILANANGTFAINPNTTDISLVDPLGTYTADTVFTIQRTAGRVRFLKDGVVIHTAAAASAGPLYPNVWLSSPTAELTLARIDTGDMDTDGLPDVWERQYLRADSGWSDLVAVEPLDNSDGTVIVNTEPVSTGDTNSNMEEFRDGTSPIDPLSKSESVVWRSDRVNSSVPSGGTLGELMKSSTTLGYNARAFGTQLILEDGLVVFQVSGNGIMTLGLNASNLMPLATNGSPSTAVLTTPDQEWAFTTTAAGTYTVKPNAAAVAPATGLNTYNASTRLMIQRVGGVVQFFRDGIVVHTAAAKSSGPLYVNVWMSTPTQQVTLARVYTGDVDNDGMPDAWELAYLANNAGFTELDAFKASGAGVASDSDGDGIQNIDEYYDGTNPFLAQLKSPVILWRPNPSSWFTLSGAWGGVKKTDNTPDSLGWWSDAVAVRLSASNQLLPQNLGQTGRLSFTATPASTLAIGFSRFDGSRTQNDLEYMFQLTKATATLPGQASIYEGTGTTTTAATLKFNLGAFDSNTRFSIRRVAQQIQYLKDGQIFYTSLVPATTELNVDSSFNAWNSEITSARLYTGDVDEDGMPDDWEITQYQRLNNNSLPSFAQLQAFSPNDDADGDSFKNREEYCYATDPLQPVSKPTGITWEGFTNTSNAPLPYSNEVKKPGYLEKINTTLGFNADATSTQIFTGDVSFSFSVPASVLTVGFTTVGRGENSNNSDTDLPYAFLFGPGLYGEGEAKAVRPESTTDLSLGSYTRQTIFTLRRIGTKIEFLKDGVVLETSTTPSTGELFADCSLSTPGTAINSAYFIDLDSDEDGMPDAWELAYLPLNATWYQLYLFFPNQETYYPPINKVDWDLDNDGVSNLDEYLYGTAADLADTDRDGMSDRWELDWGLAATDASNAAADLDSDSLINLEEYRNGTNPTLADTDADGMTDYYEVYHKLAPTDARDALLDRDNDQFPNLWEQIKLKSPSDATDKPNWDAVVDPNLGVASSWDYSYQPAVRVFQSLANCLRSRGSSTITPAFILLKPGVHRVTSLSIVGKVALVGERGANLRGELEAPIIEFNELTFENATYLDSLIFTSISSGRMVFKSAQGSANQVAISNSLFRDIRGEDASQNYWDLAPDRGTIENIGSTLTILHSTFFNCSRFYERDDDPSTTTVNEAGQIPIPTLLTLGTGSTLFGNCIIWKNGQYSRDLGSNTPSHKGTTLYLGANLFHPPIIQAVMQNDPKLSLGGYMTQDLEHLRGSQLSHYSIPTDCKGQPRDLLKPSLGAVEWINEDGDLLPDWWEYRWFGNTSKNQDDICETYSDPRLIPGTSPPQYRRLNVWDHFYENTQPTYSTDGDNLDDQWEISFFGNLAMTDIGNPDGDARNNLQEYLEGTDPNKIDDDYDSEPDGLYDYWEIKYFSNSPPLTPLRYGKDDDPDLDGWFNWEEYDRGTNPNLANVAKDKDVDLDGDDIPDVGDGLPDAWEMSYFSTLSWGPNDDFDDDELSNLQEFLDGSNPTIKPYLYDGNNNGLWDWWEISNFGSLMTDENFRRLDSDGDGRSNEREMLEGTDPQSFNEVIDYYDGDMHDFSFTSISPNYNGLEPETTGFDIYQNIINLERGEALGYHGGKVVKHDVSVRVAWNVMGRGGRHASVYFEAGRFAQTFREVDPPIGDANISVPTGRWLPWMTETKQNIRMTTPYVSSRWTVRGGMEYGDFYTVSDKLIVKKYRRTRSQQTEIFYIMPGQTHAAGNSCLIRGKGRNMLEKAYSYNNGTKVKDIGSYESLEEIALPIPRSLAPSDLAGPRYRKIGLNGVPIPDSMPGEQNEGAALPEETFVDAYSRQLRHSTSDVWCSSPSTDLPIQIRRDFTPEAWSWSSGLRPDERPDRPFGPCWSSNLTPHIRLDMSRNTSIEWVLKYYNAIFNYVDSRYHYNFWSATNGSMSENERYQEKLRNPPRINLTDERGVNYSFTDLGRGAWISATNPLDSGFQARWVHSPDERYDAKTTYDVLTQVPINAPASLATEFTLTKRNGTICKFTKCSLFQTYPANRTNPEFQKIDHYYFRLDSVLTVQKNWIKYNYFSPTTLIPSEIEDLQRPDCNIRIVQSGGRVSKILGPSEEVIHYNYSAEPGVFNPSGEDLKIDRALMGGANASIYPVLVSVTKEAQPATAPPTILQKVSYEYSYGFERDTYPDLTVGGIQTYGHLELSKITDERGNSYEFRYELNQNTMYIGWNGAFEYRRKQVGIPRMLKQIRRPDHTTAKPSMVSFSGDRSIFMTLQKRIIGEPETVVKGPCGEFTYRFYDAHTTVPRELSTFYRDGDINEGIVYLSFTRMDIKSAAGIEKYLFQPDAGMALSEVTDLSGNKTFYEYTIPFELTNSQVHSLNVKFYDDPTAEISAINDQPRDPLDKIPSIGANDKHNGRKTFTYHPIFRTRTSVTDERGIQTLTLLNSDGLPEEERLIDTRKTDNNSDDVLLRRIKNKYRPTPTPSFIGWSDLRSFLYTQTVTTDGFVKPPDYVAPTDVPSAPELEMITDYLPDINWRVWKQIKYAGPNRTNPVVTTTNYTSGGQKQTVQDTFGRVTTFEYYPQTLRLKATHYPDDTSKFIEYDAHGNITKEIDETGNATIHEYDMFNRRIKTTIDLNGDGDAGTTYTGVTLPASGNLAPVVYDGDIVTSTTYNAFNLPVTTTDPRGVVTKHEYDTIGRLISTTVNSTGAFSERQTTRYVNGNSDITDDFVGGSLFDIKGFKPLQVTDPRGFVTRYTYDKAYRVISKTLTDTTYPVGSPAREVTNYTLYDDSGNAVHQVDPLGRITSTVYDGLNRPVRVTYPGDANTPVVNTQTFYTPSGLIWRTLDEFGAETLSFHDYAGRKTHVYAPSVGVFNPSTLQTQSKRPLTITQYDDAGNVTHMTDPLGRTTETQYDSRNRPRFVIAPEVPDVVSPTGVPALVRPVTETRYDAAGRVVAAVDPLQAVTRTFYDRAGRVYRIIAPQTGDQTHDTRNKLDPSGNIVEVINAKEQVVTNVYDALNRLRQTTDPNEITNIFDYDIVGNRTSVKDGLNQESTFSYDAQKRLKSQTFANQTTQFFQYNALHKVSQEDAALRTTAYTYDARDRLRTMTSVDVSRVLTYDAAGRIVAVTESTQTQANVSQTYNTLGWLMTETSSGITHTYGYDLVGQRIYAAYGSGRTVATTYDALNRPQTITEGGRITTYGYDLAGRAVKLQTGNGNLCWNVYDVLGRLKKRTLYADVTAQTKLTDLDYDYDALGNVLSQLENWPGSALRPIGWRVTTMTYDDSNRLETETVSQSATPESLPGSQLIRTVYSYDDAHNRQTKTVLGGDEPGFLDYNYNNVNQLRSWAKYDQEAGTLQKNAILSYDKDGNRFNQAVTAAGSTQATSYQWDAQNRLKGVTMPDGSQHNYAYDYRTRRIGTDRSGGGAASKTTAIVFAGGLSLAEWEKSGTGLQPVGSAAPTVEYTRGPDMGGGVGGLLYSLRSGAPKFNLSNGRGDIVAQSDSTGELTWTASYEAYGKRTKETGTNADKQRANSKDEDPTGLLNEGFRYRDIETGVWLSRDPAGFVDGPNLYAYVQQNPWTGFDPDGLALDSIGITINGNHYGFARFTSALSGNPLGFEWGNSNSAVSDPLLGSWSVGTRNLKTNVSSIKENPMSAVKGLLGGGSDGTPAGDYGDTVHTVASIGVVRSGRGTVRPSGGLQPALIGGSSSAISSVSMPSVPMPVLFNQASANTSPEESAKTKSEQNTANSAPHGNSKLSQNAQHRYEIVENSSNDVVKTGISGKPLNQNGTSGRANGQVNELNAAEGSGTYSARVPETNLPGRQTGLNAEKTATTQLDAAGNSLRLQKRPKP